MSKNTVESIDIKGSKIHPYGTHNHIENNQSKVRQGQEGRTDRLEDKLHLLVLFVLILDIAGAEHKLGTVIVLLCRGIVLEHLFRRVAGSMTRIKLS
jgi:hypothetical protein